MKNHNHTTRIPTKSIYCEANLSLIDHLSKVSHLVTDLIDQHLLHKSNQSVK